MSNAILHASETVRVDALRPHRRNYRRHPAEERAHLVQSIRDHGVYRNVVVARDGTILAGHGVVEAAAEVGLDEIPVVRLDLDADDPRALKVLTGDNEIARLADSDDRVLAELLAEIGVDDWLGTGFDDGAYAALIARFAEEPDDAWAGMPEFEAADVESAFRATIHFRTVEDAAAFFELIDRKQAGSFWWPEHDGHVGSSLHEQYVDRP